MMRKYSVFGVVTGTPEFLDSAGKSWTLDSRRWTLDAGLWTLDSERWTLDAERWTLDVKTLKFKTVQSFGNNGVISITLFLNSTLITIFGHFSH